MSRSYRRPYATCVGKNTSSKADKRLAARCVRRAQNQHLLDRWPEEDLLLPDRYECAHNDVWGWNRDGKQRLAYELRFPGRQRCWLGTSYSAEDIACSQQYLQSLHRK